jgi:hypothetical protein
MIKYRKPPSQTWKAFLNNHIQDLVSIDFFMVPTVRKALTVAIRFNGTPEDNVTITTP